MEWYKSKKLETKSSKANAAPAPVDSNAVVLGMFEQTKKKYTGAWLMFYHSL